MPWQGSTCSAAARQRKGLAETGYARQLACDLILQDTRLAEIAGRFSTFAGEQEVIEDDPGDPSMTPT